MSGSLTPMDVTDSSSLTSMEDLVERNAQFPPGRPKFSSPGPSKKRPHPDASARSEERSAFEREGTQVSDGDPPEFGGSYENIDLYDDADIFASDVKSTTMQGASLLELLSAGAPSPKKITPPSKIVPPPASAVIISQPPPSPSRRAPYGASRESPNDDAKPSDSSTQAQTPINDAKAAKQKLPVKSLKMRLTMPRAPSPAAVARANGSSAKSTRSRAGTPATAPLPSTSAATSDPPAEPANATSTSDASPAAPEAGLNGQDATATPIQPQESVPTEVLANGDVSMETE